MLVYVFIKVLILTYANAINQTGLNKCLIVIH